MRSTPDTLAWLRGQHDHPTQSWYRLCLSLTRQARGIAGKYPTAYAGWVGATQKHPLTSSADWSKVPHGAPVYYKGQLNNGIQYGHIVTFIGVNAAGPQCWTNDALRSGGVDMVSPLWFLSHWGHTLLGWSGDLEGVNLHLSDPTSPPPVTKTVSLSDVVAAAKADPQRPTGQATQGSYHDVLTVEQALTRLGYLDQSYVDGSFGTSTVAAYRRWQGYLGYTGAAANGIPGDVSLSRLGHRFGFRVTA